jgi:hypothetical protein
MLNPVKALSVKFKVAKKGLQHTKIAFDDLDSNIQPQIREEWMNLEQIALESRGEHLKIYDINLEKGMFPMRHNWRQQAEFILCEAPSVAEIRLTLSANESTAGLPSGVISLLTQGMDLEYTQ